MISLDDFRIYEVGENSSIDPVIKQVRWFSGIKYEVVLYRGKPEEFKEYAHFRDWCLENCSNKVAFVEHDIWHNETKITVYFYSEEDAALAKLTWV